MKPWERPCTALLTAMLSLASCAAPPEPEEPIVWTDEWFECEGRFQCIIVYDAWCNFTAVNAEHARTYEFWATQEARRHDEKIPCPPAGSQPAPLPVCREGKCDLL